MIPGLLVFLAGAAAFVAVLHALAGIRMKRRSRHFLMAATALALSVFVLLSGLLYGTDSLERFILLSKIQGGVAPILLLFAWWFVAAYTRVRPLPYLLGLSAVLLAALAANQLSEAGIFYGEVLALTRAELPWGEAVTLPVATASRTQWLFNLGLFGAVPFLGFAFWRQFRRGERQEAILLAAALGAAILPAFIDTFVQGPGTMAFPFTEVSLTLFGLVLSLGLTDGVVRLAGARRRLRTTEKRARALVEGAPDGIAVVDPSTRSIVELNPAGRRLLGVREDDLPLDMSLFAPERQPDGSPSLEVEAALLEAVRAGEAPSLEWAVRRADGTEFPAEVRLGPFAGEDDGDLVRVSFLDITDRKEAERRRRELTDQLHQSQKLETLGTLAGGISHDFNNLLTPILGYTELTLDGLEPDSSLKEDLEIVWESASRARDLVQQILVFSRRRPVRSGTCYFADAVRQSLRLLQAAIPSSVELRTELEAPDGQVGLGQVQVQQVMMNLATNAQQAMPEGGTLTVAIRREEREGQGWLVLTVADTGTGIHPDALDLIFDPFFTTKETGEGTGLGLSVVHGIVTAAGGEVTVESEPGKGTRFRVVLPEVRDQVVPETSASEPSGSPGRGILVVDDNPWALDTLARMAARFGHRVSKELDPTRALEVLAASPEDVDLIIADYDMPEMTGAELARRAREVRPDVPVICVSGAAIPDEARAAFREILSKPVTLSEMRRTLTTVLDPRP